MRVSQPGAPLGLSDGLPSALLDGRTTPDSCPPSLRAWLASRLHWCGKCRPLAFHKPYKVWEFAGIPLFGETSFLDKWPKRKRKV
jgi:hypothetical protein